jgi:hypothetical protein
MRVRCVACFPGGGARRRPLPANGEPVFPSEYFSSRGSSYSESPRPRARWPQFSSRSPRTLTLSPGLDGGAPSPPEDTYTVSQTQEDNELFDTGDEVTGSFRCASCDLLIVSPKENDGVLVLPVCPLCQCEEWRSAR